jgi:hypothetical protein
VLGRTSLWFGEVGEELVDPQPQPEISFKKHFLSKVKFSLSLNLKSVSKEHLSNLTLKAELILIIGKKIIRLKLKKQTL